MKTVYTARATAVAGRNGHAETDDKKVSVDMAPPGSGKAGTNPEQLFACGYAACFGGAVEAVARKQAIKAGEVKVQADVNFNQGDDGGFFLSVTLNTFVAGVDAATARKLVEAAHQICPYSKATRGNVEVTLKANGEPLAAAA